MRGRPPGRVRPETTTVRVPVSMLSSIDAWGARHDARSRAEAVERLLVAALAQE